MTIQCSFIRESEGEKVGRAGINSLTVQIVLLTAKKVLFISTYIMRVLNFDDYKQY